MTSLATLNYLKLARVATAAKTLLQDLAHGKADERDVESLNRILKDLTVADNMNDIAAASLVGPETVDVIRTVLPNDARALQTLRRQLEQVLQGVEGARLPVREKEAALELAGLFRALRSSAYAEAGTSSQDSEDVVDAL